MTTARPRSQPVRLVPARARKLVATIPRRPRPMSAMVTTIFHRPPSHVRDGRNHRRGHASGSIAAARNHPRPTRRVSPTGQRRPDVRITKSSRDHEWVTARFTGDPKLSDRSRNHSICSPSSNQQPHHGTHRSMQQGAGPHDLLQASPPSLASTGFDRVKLAPNATENPNTIERILALDNCMSLPDLGCKLSE